MGYKAIYTNARSLAEIGVSAALSRFRALGLNTVTIAGSYHAGKKEASVAVIPSAACPTGVALYEGSDLAALAEAAGTIEACFYEPGSSRVKSDLYDVKRHPRGKGNLRGIVRPAFPDLDTRGEFLAAMQALGAGGVSEVAFYNWGHLRDASLNWIADGLAAMEHPA
jgi:hypothetical protein